MVFNIFDYLYYRTTLLYSKIERKAGFEHNKDTGAYAVTVATMFNFFGLLLTILTLVIPDVYTVFTKSKYDKIVIIFFLFGYSILISRIMKSRHENIFKKYESETEKQKKTRGTWLLVYIVISIVGFFISGYIAKIAFNQI